MKTSWRQVDRFRTRHPSSWVGIGGVVEGWGVPPLLPEIHGVGPGVRPTARYTNTICASASVHDLSSRFLFHLTKLFPA